MGTKSGGRRKLSQEAAKKQQQRPGRKSHKKRQEKGGPEKEKTEGGEGDTTTTRQQQRCMFDMAAEGSDAESKEFSKLSGVPHWESQHVCTAELVGQDLVGLELSGRRP